MANLLTKKGLWFTPFTLKWGFELLFRSFSFIFERFINSYGFLIVQTPDGWSDEGSITIDGLKINIAPFSAVVKDALGKVRSIRETETQTIDLTEQSDGTYKILAQYAPTYYEPGTITLQNGTSIVGIGTKFTENIDHNLNLVILDSALGNNGIYQVDSVENDTHLTLKKAFSGQTESVQFAIGGHFPDEAYLPSTNENWRIFEQDSYLFIVTQGAVTSDQIYFADVQKSGGELTVTEKRATNYFSIFSPKVNTFTYEHTFEMRDNFQLPDPDNPQYNKIPAHIFSVPAGGIKKVIKARSMLLYAEDEGAYTDCKVILNGEDVSDWNTIHATTEPSEISPTPIILNDFDCIEVQVTGINGQCWNLSVTLVIEVSIL